jgi:Uma2 family endonuclease
VPGTVAFVYRIVLQMGPTWRTSLFAHYRDIFEPYATNLNYYNNSQERPRVPLWDIANGCILWLPKRSEIRNEALLDPTLKNISPEFFNHPALVLEVDIQGPTSGIVYFAKMSSFSELGGVKNWLHRKNADAFNVFNQPLSNGILPIARGPSSPLEHNQNHVFAS